MIPSDQRERLRALLSGKMKRRDRLQAMTALISADGIVALMLDTAEKHGTDRAIDRLQLPLLATKALIEGKPYTAPKRPTCGAKTRTGAPCKRKPISGKRRCRNHGGLSTGPRTLEGQARSKKNLLLRWTR
jgi:hypothetical protein